MLFTVGSIRFGPVRIQLRQAQHLFVQNMWEKSYVKPTIAWTNRKWANIKWHNTTKLSMYQLRAGDSLKLYQCQYVSRRFVLMITYLALNNQQIIYHTIMAWIWKLNWEKQINRKSIWQGRGLIERLKRKNTCNWTSKVAKNSISAHFILLTSGKHGEVNYTCHFLNLGI